MNAMLENNLIGLFFRKCSYGKSLKELIFKPHCVTTSLPCENLAISFALKRKGVT